MTIYEVNEKYMIPITILEKYELWEINSTKKEKTGSYHYDENDIEILSIIMTLLNIGFTYNETENYISLLLIKHDTRKERIKIILKKRKQILDEIHLKLNQIDKLDYIRFKLQNKK